MLFYVVCHFGFPNYLQLISPLILVYFSLLLLLLYCMTGYACYAWGAIEQHLWLLSAQPLSGQCGSPRPLAARFFAASSVVASQLFWWSTSKPEFSEDCLTKVGCFKSKPTDCKRNKERYCKDQRFIRLYTT